MTERKIYSNEIDPADIVWISVPLHGKFEDIAFIRTEGELIPIRVRQAA